MTSEEIIERLIDEKKLSVKEAMVIIHRYSFPWCNISSITTNDLYKTVTVKTVKYINNEIK